MDERTSHIKRAHQAYESMKLLSAKGLLADAFSRGYYAIIHTSFALLIKHDISLPKTHAGLVSRLWEEKKKLGIPAKLVREVSRFQSLREEGDYASLPFIEKSDLKKLEAAITSFFRLAGEKA